MEEEKTTVKKRGRPKKTICGENSFVCSKCKQVFNKTLKKKFDDSVDAKDYCVDCYKKQLENNKKKLIKRESETCLCTDCKKETNREEIVYWGLGSFCPTCWKKDKHKNDREFKKIFDVIKEEMINTGCEEQTVNDSFPRIDRTINNIKEKNNWELKDIYLALRYYFKYINYNTFNLNFLDSAIERGYPEAKKIQRKNKAIKKENEGILNEETNIFKEEYVYINREEQMIFNNLENYRKFQKALSDCDLSKTLEDEEAYPTYDPDDDLF